MDKIRRIFAQIIRNQDMTKRKHDKVM